ncbi:hypothetical protein F4679DRAFT_407060 [Xylaria curta]|nr:hypothetical protein F4679DRAFT_407060 [Xylaria curta]
MTDSTSCTIASHTIILVHLAVSVTQAMHLPPFSPFQSPILLQYRPSPYKRHQAQVAHAGPHIMTDQDWAAALKDWDVESFGGAHLTRPASLETPRRAAEVGGDASLAKAKGGSDSNTGMRTEKLSALTRPSVEIISNSMRIDDNDENNNNKNNNDSKNDDDDSSSENEKSKRSKTPEYNSSDDTTDSNDERRLSNKVKKAWRGVRGQKLADPLEQWMVKHSGGTLRDVPITRSPRGGSPNK